MSGFPYDVTDRSATALGLIVLRVDETIEDDFRSMFPRDVAKVHVTRVTSGDHLTPETISAMEAGLTVAAGLLPEAAGFDVVGYGCTSGAAMIGSDAVAARVGEGVPARAVTHPLAGLIAAADALGVRRLGVVSPYIPSVGAPLEAALATAGLEVTDTLTFGEEVEARVAQIDPGSVVQAARSLHARSDMDAVFLSCTNLRTFGIIDPLEAELDLPVLSSNQVLGWHMARLSGVAATGPGRLFAL